ncbi:hypothetical protein RMCBS344292_09864 [Rhizopus microsporus]|nr:hypothetical protein RMCBS344292_09864 [Rhizopus microsporus]
MKRSRNIISPAKEKDVQQQKELSVSSDSMMIQLSSPVKQLFPSISMFNLPSTIPNTPPHEAAKVDPPPQFAIDIDTAERFKRQCKKLYIKRHLQEAYPSAFETYLFDDTPPGAPPSQGIRPVRLLLERLEAWHLLAKRLLYHFEILASVEAKVAKQYRVLDDVMIFPSPSDAPPEEHNYRRRPMITRSQRQKVFFKDQRLLQVHFNFAGGIRSVCDTWQTYHSNAAKDHAEFATFLRSKAISTLSNIKQELKWMIEAIHSDDRLSLDTLTSLKREASKRLKRLDRQLLFFDKHPFYAYKKKDPWLINASVVKQMVKVYRQENKIHETVLRLQKEIHLSEEQLVEEFKHLCQHIYHMRSQSYLGVDRGLEAVLKAFENIKIDSDWMNFCQQHHDHLVSEKAAFRNPDLLQYPNHNHPLLQPIFAARMERRSMVLHQWQEYIYVLTPAGFLHEYRDGRNYPGKPDETLFVPHFKVSTLSTNLHHSLIFQLQPHAASRNILNSYPAPRDWRTPSTSRLNRALSNRLTWTFRAKSAADMERWIEELTLASESYRPFLPTANGYREQEEPQNEAETTASEESTEEKGDEKIEEQAEKAVKEKVEETVEKSVEEQLSNEQEEVKEEAPQEPAPETSQEPVVEPATSDTTQPEEQAP